MVIHSAFYPYGLILALLATGVGIWILGKTLGLRRFKLVAALAWAYVALRGGTPGVGGELLVQGNFAGNALVNAGIATMAIALALEP